MVVGLWGYAYGLKKEESTLFGLPLPKLVVCGSATAVIALLTGMLNALIGSLILFALFGLPHASLHTASSADAIDALELQPVVGS